MNGPHGVVWGMAPLVAFRGLFRRQRCLFWELPLSRSTPVGAELLGLLGRLVQARGGTLRIKSRFFFVASEALHAPAPAHLSRPSQYQLPFAHHISVSPIFGDGSCHRIFALASSSAWIVLPPGAPVTISPPSSAERSPTSLERTAWNTIFATPQISLHHHNKKP